MRYFAFLCLLLVAPLAMGDEMAVGTQTTAALTLYASPGGSDNNSCLFPHQACKTTQGMLDKVPKLIRHAVVLQYAPGNYPEAADVQGFTIEAPPSTSLFSPSLPHATSGDLRFRGGVTVQESGTMTGWANASNPTLATITDTGKTWTTNALKGRLVEITSGTQAGSRRVITANTATTLELAQGYSSGISAGTTYSIEVPSVVLGAVNIGYANTGRTITFEMVDLSTTGSSGALRLAAPAPMGIQLLYSRALATGATNLAVSTYGTSVYCNNSYIGSVGGAAFYSTPYAYANLDGGAFVPAGCFLSGGSTVGGVLQISNSTSTGLFNSMVIETTSTTAANGVGVLSLSSSSYQSVGYNSLGFVMIRCPAGSTTNIGISPYSYQEAMVYRAIGGLRIENCATGISVPAMSTFTNGGSGAISILNATTGISVSRGGTAFISGVTMSGVSTEVSVDGTGSTLAAIDALSPKILANANTGSRVWRQ